ncbi:MAG: CpsD/CapB family tyrosine-protein kinase, partial [Gordonia polyisoprenivorans]|nr:CpsD/CapB family tyrosine-protein kinase [Gordonia polyisoprenivorans]
VIGQQLRTSDGQPLATVVPVNPAIVPSSPIRPNKELDIGLGFVVGLLLGVGVVVMRRVFDQTIKSPADLATLEIPVLGLVPFDRSVSKTPVAVRGDPHSSLSEAYRQLRLNMQFVNVDEPPRVIAVTSGIPGEGKSTTAMNLAAALADAGNRVVLLEADLRRPAIAAAMGLSPDVGFTTVLIGQATVEEALQNAGRNLAVLTSGPIPPNPSELLVSEQANALVRTLGDHADFVIIDTAPLLPVADGSEVAALADATLVVHRSGKTTREQAARSMESLARVGRRPVGVVLNMTSPTQSGYDYPYAERFRSTRLRGSGTTKPQAHVSSLPQEPPVGDELSIDEIVSSDPELLEQPVDDAESSDGGQALGGRFGNRFEK